MRSAARGAACLALLAAFAASSFGAPAPAPTVATPVPTFLVVQKDGSTVRLAKAPVVKGSNLVGNLWQTGELVSLRLDTIDLGKTAAANKGGKTGAPPPQKDVGTRYNPAGPQTPLGSRVKLKKGRKDAEKSLSSASGTAKAGEDDLPERAEPGTRAEASKAARVVDRDGRGESYWRGRATVLREDLADAEAELKIATDDRDFFERTDPPPGEGATATWAGELQRRRDRVDRARQRVDAAKRRQEELAEEARKADALPGWLR
jgi:hypothetical protein